MYSGFYWTSHSSQWFGVHQKLNRIAYRMLEQAVLELDFPELKQIQKFEGTNGPDGIKLKSPSQNEPWHYYDPFDDEDNKILELLNGNFDSLKAALKKKNQERAAFEASWLAHGLTDGLTPAHQFPYEHEIERITGKHHLERKTRKQKVIAAGKNKRETVSKNWELWGTKGLFITHQGFEMGVAAIILPMRNRKFSLTKAQIVEAEELGMEKLFQKSALRIAKFHMYERFYKSGWTLGLGQDVKQVLLPEIAKSVALSWYLAHKQTK